MERLTGPGLDRDAIRRHVDAARVALRSLDDLAAASAEGAALSGKVVSQHLGVAMSELSGVDHQFSLESNAPPDTSRVACTFCGRMIMSTATLCGFCWRRRGGDPAIA